MVLVAVMLALLWVNSRLLRGRAVHRLGPGPARPPRPYRARALALAGARLLLGAWS